MPRRPEHQRATIEPLLPELRKGNEEDVHGRQVAGSACACIRSGEQGYRSILDSEEIVYGNAPIVTLCAMNPMAIVHSGRFHASILYRGWEERYPESSHSYPHRLR